MVRIVAISDSHTLHDQLSIPDGDIFIHAGDFTEIGLPDEVRRFNEFLGNLAHPHKIVIAGNHDIGFERKQQEVVPLLNNCTYLQDNLVVIEGLRIYGSPWIPSCFGAFNLRSPNDLRKKWQKIPRGIDILLTHGPPHGYLDRTSYGREVGCQELNKIVQLVNPQYHIFGHIHEAAGVLTAGKTTFVNASSCDREYKIAHSPIVFDIEK